MITFNEYPSIFSRLCNTLRGVFTHSIGLELRKYDWTELYLETTAFLGKKAISWVYSRYRIGVNTASVIWSLGASCRSTSALSLLAPSDLACTIEHQECQSTLLEPPFLQPLGFLKVTLHFQLGNKAVGGHCIQHSWTIVACDRIRNPDRKALIMERACRRAGPLFPARQPG